MAKNWLPLNFLVRSKTHIFLESVELFKKTEHSVQFLFGHLVGFQDQNIMTSVKYQFFQNVTYCISIEKLFSTDQVLVKDLGVYDSCSRVRRFGIKIMTS